MHIGIKLDVSRFEPDVDLIFLRTKEQNQLGTACARADTDIHVTGASHTQHVLATTTPTTVVLKLDSKQIRNIYKSENNTTTVVDISNRIRVNSTASRIGLGIDGTVGNTVSGQGSIALSKLIKDTIDKKSTISEVTYTNFYAFSCVLEFSNSMIIDIDTGNKIIPNFVYDEETDAQCLNAQAVLEDMYTKASKLREIVSYKPAEALTKSVMRVPFGIDGSTFDAVSNVVDRPSALSDKAFESLARASLKIALAVDEPGDKKLSMNDFLRDTAQPSIHAASVYSHKVSNAMSTLVCLICPYRIDGRTMVMPDGLQMVPCESWKGESPRDIFSTDDCEGAAAIQTSLVYRAETISRDPKLSVMYPCISGIANSLVHHIVGISVLSANAGQADSAGDNGHEAIAGHAIMLAIPKPQALKSLLNGIISTAVYEFAEKQQHSKQMSEDVREPYARALYHPEDLKRMPADDVAILSTADGVLSLTERMDITTLASEGTSPVASSKLYETDATIRLEQIKLARQEKDIQQQLGPSISRDFTRLHVPLNTQSPSHQFYNTILEFAVPLRRYGTFQNSDVRSIGHATSHWVLAQTHDVKSAGASPKDIATGNFSMLPLWMLSETQCVALEVASSEVLSNTLPVRERLVKLTPTQYDTYNANIDLLKTLNATKSELFSSLVSNRHASRHIFTFAALVGNAKSVTAFVNEVENDSNIACRVTMEATPNVFFSASGNDIAVVPLIEMVKF